MRDGFRSLFARICKTLGLRSRLLDSRQRETKPATGCVEVMGRRAEVPVSEELRHVGCEHACFFEPGRRLVTKIAKLESLKARSLTCVFPRGPNRLDAIAEPVAEDVCVCGDQRD